MDAKINRKAQMTLFVIFGILLALALVLLVIFQGNFDLSTGKTTYDNPEEFIDNCVKDKVGDAVELMLGQGGFVSPNNSILYEEKQVQYLCYNKNYYNPCITQVPLYITHLENDINDYITPKVEKCFADLKKGLEEKNYVIEMSGMDLKTNLNPGQVDVEIIRQFSMSKNQETKKINEFNSVAFSSLYDLGIVAQEIASQEAKYCYFEYVGFMSYYPWISIDKFVFGDGPKVYSLEDRKTKEKLNIAVRSCVLPAGY